MSNQLSDFSIKQVFGEGSFATVYKVVRKFDGQVYAMKKIRFQNLKEKDRENSLNEVRILASIESNYIISYKDSFIEDNSLYIVMEFAEKGDLQKMINHYKKNQKLIDEKVVWKALQNMVQGLKVLHANDVLHRDLKCANIFITGDSIFKLGDMNVSKVVKQGLAYTQTGTPYYASPEVWRDQPYDEKSDIWSLGVVLYEMCAQQPPFKAKDMEGLFQKVQKGEYTRIPNYYSDELSYVLSLMLQVKPGKRPSTSQILEHPMLSKYSKGAKENIQQSDMLYQTIKVPKNLQQLKGKLPKPKYAKSQMDIDISSQYIAKKENISITNRIQSAKISFSQQNNYQHVSNQNSHYQQKKPSIHHINNNSVVKNDLSVNLKNDLSINKKNDTSMNNKSNIIVNSKMNEAQVLSPYKQININNIQHQQHLLNQQIIANKLKQMELKNKQLKLQAQQQIKQQNYIIQNSQKKESIVNSSHISNSGRKNNQSQQKSKLYSPDIQKSSQQKVHLLSPENYKQQYKIIMTSPDNKNMAPKIYLPSPGKISEKTKINQMLKKKQESMHKNQSQDRSKISSPSKNQFKSKMSDRPKTSTSHVPASSISHMNSKNNINKVHVKSGISLIQKQHTNRPQSGYENSSFLAKSFVTNQVSIQRLHSPQYKFQNVDRQQIESYKNRLQLKEKQVFGSLIDSYQIQKKDIKGILKIQH